MAEVAPNQVAPLPAGAEETTEASPPEAVDVPPPAAAEVEPNAVEAPALVPVEVRSVCYAG
jgi:hypothetical protein